MKKAWIIKSIFLFVAYIFLFVSIYQYHELKKIENNMEDYAVLPVISNQYITFTEIEKIGSSEDNVLGAYSILYDETLYASDLPKSINANIIICDFSVDDIWITSKSLLKADKSGCLLSSESMYQLFGTLDVDNQRIGINGNDYYVRGIVPAKEEFVIMQYSNQNKQDMGFISGIVFNVSDESYRSQYVEMFCNTYQIGKKEQVYYVSDYTTLFGRTTLPTSWVALFRNKEGKEEIQKRIYRKLYENKDPIECYYYHFTWKNLKWQCMILTGMILCIWISVAFMRDTILKKKQ